MYNKTTVQAAFFDLVKWRDYDNPNIPSLDGTLTSSSGVFYNDINPMLYPENIEKVLKQYDSFDYSVWDNSTTYAIGDKVIYDSHAYVAKTSNTNKQPDTQTDDWKTLISQELINKTNDNIINVVESILIDKKLSGLKPLLNDLRVFEGAGRVNDVIIKESRFVGISIALKKFNSLRVTLNRLGAQFTQINTDLDIYVYHSSQDTYIKTFKISTTEANSFAWSDVTDCILDYVSYTGYDTGMFFIGYFEDDLSGQAIRKQIDFSKEPTGCATCLNQLHNLYAYNLYNDYVSIKPFSVSMDDATLFDIEDVSFYDDTNFGLNMHLTVECDITQLLVDNKSRFTDVLRKQMTVDMLKAIAYTVRDNIFEDRLRDNALMELKGVDGKAGLEDKLEKAYKAIDLEMTIKSPCLGRKKRGIKSGAI